MESLNVCAGDWHIVPCVCESFMNVSPVSASNSLQLGTYPVSQDTAKSSVLMFQSGINVFLAPHAWLDSLFSRQDLSKRTVWYIYIYILFFHRCLLRYPFIIIWHYFNHTTDIGTSVSDFQMIRLERYNHSLFFQRLGMKLHKHELQPNTCSSPCLSSRTSSPVDSVNIFQENVVFLCET